MLLVLGASTARADDRVVESFAPLSTALSVAELLVPDVRFEISSDDTHWVLSLPLAVYSKRLSPASRLHPFIEP